VNDVSIKSLYEHKSVLVLNISTDVSGQMSTHFGGQTRTFDEYLISFVLEFSPN
jgi:hypothetical protein